MTYSFTSNRSSCKNHLHDSVQFSSVVSNSLWTNELQHTMLPCPSPTPGACSNTYPSSQRCDLTISSSVIPFFSCLQCFPVSRSFPMSQFFTSGGPRIGASVLASVLPMNIWNWFPLWLTGWISLQYIRNWFPLWLTGWISLQYKRLSRVFSNITVQKHQFFSTHLSL